MIYKMRNGIYRDGLIDLIRYVKSKITVNSMIEIGSYAGESTELFIYGFDSLIHCIDSWKNGYDLKDVASQSDMSLVETNFNQKTLGKNVIKMRMTSDRAVCYFKNKSQDLVYIDGNHQYNQFRKDLENYLPKIKKGGFLAGHDYSNPDIQRALKDLDIKVDKIFKDDSFITGEL